MLCNAGWREWRSLVRTRALDLYPSSEAIEFWDAVDDQDDEAAVWGNWPRHVTLGGRALVAELLEEAVQLRDRGLALLFVYSSPRDPELRPAATRQPEQAAARTVERDCLEALAAGLTLQQRRNVLRLGVFWGAPQQDDHQAAAALVREGLFDSAIFLGEEGPGHQTDTALQRRFQALRIVVDISRDRDKETGKLNQWEWVKSERGRPPVYDIVVPWPEPGSRLAPDPSIALGQEIVFYLKQKLSGEGEDANGKIEIGGLRQYVEELVARAKENVGKVSVETVSQPGRGDLVATGRAVGQKPRILADEPPEQPSRVAVDRWIDDIRGQLRTIVGQRRNDIEKRKDELNEIFQNGERAIRERTERMIQAQRDGLQVYVLTELDKLRDELLTHQQTIAASLITARNGIRNRMARETDPAMAAAARAAVHLAMSHGPATVAADTEQLLSIASYRALEDAFYRFRERTANIARRSRYGIGVALVAFATWAVLGLNLRELDPASDAWQTMILLGNDLPVIGVGVVVTALTGLAALGTILYYKEGWELRRDQVRAQAWAFASDVRIVLKDSEHYSVGSAYMSNLLLIGHRLAMLEQEILNSDKRNAALNALENGVGLPADDPKRRTGFRERMKPHTDRTAADGWIRTMLANAEPPPARKVELDFGAGRTGEGVLATALDIAGAIRIDDALAR